MATFNDIATAIKTQLEAISGAPTISVRKDGTIHPRDTLPIVIVSLWSDETDTWGTTGDAGNTDYGHAGHEYTVALSMYRASLADIESDLSDTTSFWQSSKKTLNKGVLSGVSSVWNVRIQDSEAFDRQAWKEGHEVSQIFIVACTAGSRNG